MLDVGALIQRCDIASVLGRLGISYERRKNKNGHELYFCCPTNNHQSNPDKKRCSIAESGKYKGMFNCWACDFHGNLIQLVQFITEKDFKQALHFLESEYGSAQVAGIDALNYRLKMAKGEVSLAKQLPEFSLPDDYQPLIKLDSRNARLAKQWLIEERNINQEYMDMFQIGMTTHATLGPMIVVPVIFKGKIHSVFTAQPFKGGLKRYPKNSPQGDILFNYDRCIAAGRYVIVESILDAIKYECVVGEPAMACFTNMISSRQLELLRNFSEHGVMPDLDGVRGWDLVDRMVPSIGKNLWLYFCPIGKDPGDCTPQELADGRKNRVRYCEYETTQWLSSQQHTPPKILHVRKN